MTYHQREVTKSNFWTASVRLWKWNPVLWPQCLTEHYYSGSPVHHSLTLQRTSAEYLITPLTWACNGAYAAHVPHVSPMSEIPSGCLSLLELNSTWTWMGFNFWQQMHRILWLTVFMPKTKQRQNKKKQNTPYKNKNQRNEESSLGVLLLWLYFARMGWWTLGLTVKKIFFFWSKNSFTLAVHGSLWPGCRPFKCKLLVLGLFCLWCPSHPVSSQLPAHVRGSGLPARPGISLEQAI